jgi:AcrR family transcriptional regulator
MTGQAATRRYSKRMPRQERREQLLDATLTVIARDGWPALRINRVAAEADIAKSVIYSIFGSMEGLQKAVMRREQERAFALSELALDEARSNQDPVTAITGALGIFLTGVAKNPTTWRLVLVPAENTPPAIRAGILAGRERWRQEIEAVLRNLLGDSEPDVELASHVVRGNAEYLARLIVEDPGRFSPERITALGSRLVEALLERKPA